MIHIGDTVAYNLRDLPRKIPVSEWMFCRYIKEGELDGGVDTASRGWDSVSRQWGTFPEPIDLMLRRA
jgi:hypothetical protein